MSTYSKIGLAKVINASGRMTKLGVSCISDSTAEAMKQGGQNYVLIDDLYKLAGKELAGYVNAIDSCVTASASSAIALSVASLICKDDLQKVRNFYECSTKTNKREVIILKGQNVDFGAPISTIVESGGGIVKEVGFANSSSVEDLRYGVNENTLAILYVKSHHCVQKNMISAAEAISFANEISVPIIIDAAAEEDLEKYTKLGADFVCYSGSKAISGPTSGFAICSSVEYADNMRLQYKGIGRIMKVGKENIMGLLSAVHEYQKNKGYIPVVGIEELREFTNKSNQIIGISATIVKDEAGREIYRTKLDINTEEYGISANELVKKLENNDPKIYTRDYQASLGSIAIDPRPLGSEDELDEIYNALKHYGKKV